MFVIHPFYQFHTITPSFLHPVVSSFCHFSSFRVYSFISSSRRFFILFFSIIFIFIPSFLHPVVSSFLRFVFVPSFLRFFCAQNVNVCSFFGVANSNVSHFCRMIKLKQRMNEFVQKQKCQKKSPSELGEHFIFVRCLSEWWMVRIDTFACTHIHEPEVLYIKNDVCV